MIRTREGLEYLLTLISALETAEEQLDCWKAPTSEMVFKKKAMLESLDKFINELTVL